MYSESSPSRATPDAKVMGDYLASRNEVYRIVVDQPIEQNHNAHHTLPVSLKFFSFVVMESRSDAPVFADLLFQLEHLVAHGLNAERYQTAEDPDSIQHD